MHVPVPEQPPPLQPVNTDPDAAAACNVTDAPLPKSEEQVPPQEMLAGLLVTVPAPLPAFATVKLTFPTASVILVVCVRLPPVP